MSTLLRHKTSYKMALPESMPLYEGQKTRRSRRGSGWRRFLGLSLLVCGLMTATFQFAGRGLHTQLGQILQNLGHEDFSGQINEDHDLTLFSGLNEWTLANHPGASFGFHGSTFSPHPDSGFGTVAAVLPVTSTNIGNLQALTGPLLAEDSSIAAIVLVCPAELLSSLDTMFLGEATGPFLDISVSIWSDGLQEASAVIFAASRANAEYALLLGSTGLLGLDATLQKHLLSHPVLLDIPVGVCGFNTLNSDQAQNYCVHPTHEAQAVAFLVPPMVLPTAALHDYNASTGNSFDSWKHLGASFYRDEQVGGFIQPGAMLKSTWCSTICDGVLGKALSTHRLNEATSLVKSEETFTPSSIAIILPTVHDLEDFSPAACRMLRNGIHLHVLILSHNAHHFPQRNSSYPWLHDHLISSRCQVPYSALHESQNVFANAEAAGYWLDTSNKTYSSIIIGVNDKKISALEFNLERRRSRGTTLIKIPVHELRYCDWIGSLTELEIANWHAPTISISVITDQRPDSLSRLLHSLDKAIYFGDTPDLRINMEHSADAKTHQVVKTFEWRLGSTFIHQRIVHGDLLPAVVESWFPHSNDSYGVTLEDDVEVSPLFYGWVKFGILRYRYGSSENRDLSIFGISLYQQKNLELHPDGRKLFDARSLFESSHLPFINTPFLSQIPCSWGAVYFPEHWAEFHTFLRTRLDEKWMALREDVVPDVRSNNWTRSWKRYFIELVYLRGYVMLYPNFGEFTSLSTNHLEVGSHVKDQPRNIYEQKKRLFTLPLMQLPESSGPSTASGLLDLPEERLPDWVDLPVLDLLGTITTGEEIVRRGAARQTEVADCATVARDITRRKAFDAKDLFACSGGAEDYDVFEDLDALHYDI